MKQTQLDPSQLLTLIRRNLRPIALWSLLGALLGLLIALSTPYSYTSHSLIAPEDNSANLSGSMNMVASLIGINGGGESAGINSAIYSDVLRSSPLLMQLSDMPVNSSLTPLHSYLLDSLKSPWWNLSALFSSPSHTPFASSIKHQQKFVETLNDAIQISQDDKTRIYSLSITLQNPRIAKLLLDSMLVKLKDYMNYYYTAKEREKLAANSSMLTQAKSDYYAKDELYALFSDANQNLISKSAKIKLQRLKDERDLAFQIYSQLALEVQSNQLKIQNSHTITTVIEPPTLPTKPSSPRMLFTTIGLAFLAGFTKIIFLIIKL